MNETDPLINEIKPKNIWKIVKCESTPDYVGIVVLKISDNGKTMEQKGMKLMAQGIYEQICWQEGLDSGDIKPVNPK